MLGEAPVEVFAGVEWVEDEADMTSISDIWF